MKDKSKDTTESLSAKFLEMGTAISKEWDPWTIYLKCNTMRKIWVELEKRGVKPPWEAIEKATDPLKDARLRYTTPKADA